MNRFLPAIAQTTTQLSLQIPIQVQEGDVWKLPVGYKPDPGSLVRLFNANGQPVGEGIVLPYTGDEVPFRVTSLADQPVYGKVERGWSPIVQTLTVVSTAAFFGTGPSTLDVLCRLPKGQPIGFVRWKLYYAGVDGVEILVLQGRDTNSPGSIHYTHAYQWAVGSYRLEAFSLDQQYAIVAAHDECGWVLSAPTTALSWGQPTDSTPPLNLG